jgi:hypothetical protein
VNTIIGIDPGKDGAVVILQDGQPFHQWLTRERFTAPTGKGSKRDYLPGEMVEALEALTPNRGDYPHLAVLERQAAMPGQGGTSMFSIGYGYGLWAGILAALEIPVQIVSPQTWAKEILKGAPGEGKARAIHAAGRLLRKPHSGIADAACLALYGARLLGKE